MPPKEQRRPNSKKMTAGEIQAEIATIRARLTAPIAPGPERTSLRNRLATLQKTFDELYGEEGAGAGEGGGEVRGRAGASKRRVDNDEIRGRIDAIEAAIRFESDPAEIAQLREQRAGLIEQLGVDPRQRQRREEEVVEISDDEGEGPPAAAAPSSSSSSSSSSAYEADAYTYESTHIERGAGEGDLEYLQRLVRGEAQLTRVIERLRTDHAAAAERASVSTAKYTEEERAKQAEFNAIEEEDIDLQRKQDRQFENVSIRYRLKQEHKKEMETLENIQIETARLIAEHAPELERLTATIRNLKVKPRVAFAIKERYPGKTPAEAFEAFVKDNSSFGRRRIRRNLFSFFGNYTATHPNADARTVVQKYARALMYT
jgi:hypothetical protein